MKEGKFDLYILSWKVEIKSCWKNYLAKAGMSSKEMKIERLVSLLMEVPKLVGKWSGKQKNIS